MRLVAKSRKCFLLLFVFLSVISSAIGQERIRVTGRVIDDSSRIPLSGATVMVKGDSRSGTVTAADGSYSIEAPSNGTLVISSLGHFEREIPVSNQQSINVNLLSRTNELSDVVVIGYGTRLRRDVTGAISQVGAKDIEKSTSMTPELALQGRAAGVFVNAGGGDPQARPTVRIRGVNTNGYADPLYVVDGVPIYEGGGGVTGGAIGDIRSPINIYTLVNPQDIESISVLKDASSAAIYGVRASNGVILITTKRGKTGRPKVEVATSIGIQNIPRKYSVLNTQEYFALVREAYNANPDANTTFEAKYGPRYNPASPLYAGNNPTYDWQGMLINKNAGLQDHSVRLSGGSEATTYYVSAGFTRTESPLKANNLRRYSVAANFDSKISKFLQVGLTLRLVQEEALVNTQSDLPTMASTIPFQPFLDPNDPTGYARVSAGTLIPNTAYNPTLLDPGPPFVFQSPTTLIWGQQSRFNVFAFHQLNRNAYDLKRAMGNAYVQIEPITGLKIKASLGGDWYMNLRKLWNDFEAWRFSQTPANPTAGSPPQALGSYAERRGTTYNINKEITINYNRTFFGDHNIDLILGASDQFAKWNVSDLSGKVNYTDPQFRSIASQPPFTSGFASILEEDALLGYYGRLSYKFKDKYYVDGTLRYDGSSRLAPGHKWDYFPSFALAWRVSGEKFFPKTTFINDLKIRGGWGKLGNFQSAGRYKYLSIVSFSPDYPLGSGNGNPTGTQTQGARLPDFANTELTWEKLKTTNIGFDAVLFSNISFTAEYYHKMTYDVIQNLPLPPNTGVQSNADLNIAQIRNTGVEFQLGYNNNFGPVNFRASANLTTVKNRVMKLNLGNPLGDENGRTEVGFPLFYLWGYKVGGIFQSQAEINAWRAVYADGNIGQNRTNPTAGYQYKPGDMYFQDVYGSPKTRFERFSTTRDSVINASDRSYLGKTIPSYYYGFDFSANWMGVDVSVFFQGVGGVQKYNGTRAGLEGMGGLANQSRSVLNRWTPTNPSNTIPRAVFNNPSTPTRFSDRFVEDAGYIRLRNVQLGYTLPRTILTKLSFIQSFRIYASAVNLFTITNWSGLDPETDGVPVTRQFLFGINASF